MKKEKIAVLEIKPMEHPRVCSIESTIEAFRKAVLTDIIEYGDVEAKRISRDAYVLFNKDRFLTGLMPNRQICGDIICGTMYIVAIVMIILFFYYTPPPPRKRHSGKSSSPLLTRQWSAEARLGFS